ncbi:MAG TPA: hypothetical protein DD638_07670 [Pasteurellaceae bacterium]|nr:hypothetical protein [Pasteurellaceae bacterium]
MRILDFDVIAPSVFSEQEIDEAQLFGAFATIWLRSDYHSKAPLYKFAERILPILRTKQFALFIQDKVPVAYFSWAAFSQEMENAYLVDDDVLLTQANWQSGSLLWIIDWFASDGVGKKLKPIIANHLFPHEIMTALYHKSSQGNIRKLYFKGSAVSKEAFESFIRNHQ